MSGFKEDPDAPPTTIEKNSVECRLDPTVPEGVLAALRSVPDLYLVPGRAHRSQVARLHTLAVLLAGDGIDEQAIAKADQHLLDTLKRERARLEADGQLARTVKRLKTVSYQEMGFGVLDDESVEVKARQISADTRNIHDLLKAAGRTLRDGLACGAWGTLVEAGEDADQAKLITAALGSEDGVGAAVESSAQGLVQRWLGERSRAISDLPEKRKVMYYEVRSQARESEQIERSLPSAITAPGDESAWERHVFVNGRGKFPAKFTSWESEVLKAELNPDQEPRRVVPQSNRRRPRPAGSLSVRRLREADVPGLRLLP